MRFRFLTLLLGVVFIIVSSASADGKLLRGEKWKKFNPEGKKADFYISLDGNDELFIVFNLSLFDNQIKR